MNRFLPFILLLFSVTVLTAQVRQGPTFKISGKIMEKSTGQPLEFATVIMRPMRGERVFGGMTDASGSYSFEAPGGMYTVQFEFLSFKTITLPNVRIDQDKTFDTVYLEEDSETLQEVEVIAERSTMEVKLDKKVYNVGKDMTVKGGTASDVLDNVPSVTVDADGVVSLRGNENVRILINGKPSGLVGINDTEALRQFPADAIEKVEVITSPSARYDAEGTAGILNIILRQDKTTGFNGTISTFLGIPSYYGLSSSLNYRLKKVNFFANVGYSDRDGPGNAHFFTEYFSPEATYAFTEQNIDYQRNGKDLNTNFGLEFFLKPQTTITASFLYRNSDRSHVAENVTDGLDGMGELQNTTVRTEAEGSQDDVVQYDLNFMHRFEKEGHQLSFDLQYQDNQDLEKTLITNEEVFPGPVSLPSEKIDADEMQNSILLKGDYVRPLEKEEQLELGFRIDLNAQETDYKFYNEDENGEFIVNDRLTNLFIYDEDIAAAYAQYGKKFGKFSALFGLRMESTDIHIRVTGKDIDSISDKNYVNWFPTANLVYELREDENITLGFNRRIRRPRSRFINPFPSQSSRTNIFQGNPDLDPEISSGLDLGYNRRWSKVGFTTSLYYTHSTDVFQFISMDTGESTEDGIPIIRRTPVNLSTDDRIGFEFSVNYTPKRNWRFNTSFNFFNSNLDGTYEGVDYAYRNTSWFARFSSKLELPAKIDWQTTMMFRGPSEDSQSKRDGIFIANMAFSKDILKGNGTITFNVDDLLNSRKRMSETSTPTFYEDSEFQWRERQWRLSFVYRFNQKKQRERERGMNGGEDEESFGS